ncbi:MAG: hypothetical protein ISS23_03410 [Nanoarchaeota archaeon]|nr:hypothetical protein [Nanoarchaeota archaeon]
MALKKIIDEALTELNTIPDHFQNWKILKDELKKRGLSGYEKKARQVNIEEVGKILTILEKLNERFVYTNIMDNSENDRSDFDKILELCRLEGKTLDMLDSLADTGYFLGYGSAPNKNIIDYDIKSFKRLLKNDLFKKYKSVFNSLKEYLGYEHDPKSCVFDFFSHQFDKITKIAETEGDPCSAIYLLSNEGYQINEEIGLTDTDVECISKIAKSLQGSSVEIVSSFLYKEENPEAFQKYFSSLSDHEQRTVLNKILEMDYENKEIVDWLDEKKCELLQEVGFS